MTWELHQLDPSSDSGVGYRLWTPSVANPSLPKPLVILGQPYNVSSEWIFLETARELTDRGFVVVATELRGRHGDPEFAPGAFSFQDHAADYRAIAEAVMALDFVDRRQVVFHGYSYSAVFAALAAPDLQPALVVLQAPVLYPDETHDQTREIFMHTHENRFALNKFLRQRHFDAEWLALRQPLEALQRYTRQPISRVAVVSHGLDEVMPVGVAGSYYEAAMPGHGVEVTLPRLYHYGPVGHGAVFAKPLAELIERELPLAFARRRRVDIIQSRAPSGVAFTSARVHVRIGSRHEMTTLDDVAVTVEAGTRDDLLRFYVEDQPMLVRGTADADLVRFSIELVGADGLTLATTNGYVQPDHHLSKRRIDGVNIIGWQLPAHGFGLLASTDEQDGDEMALQAEVKRAAREVPEETTVEELTEVSDILS